MRFLARRMMSRWLLLAVVMMSGAVVSARQVLQDSVCLVPAGTTVEGTLIVLCDTLRVEGVVNGDVFGVGLRTTISGVVRGSVYLAGFALTHTGTIDRALHYAGITLLITAPAEGDGALVGGNALVGVLRGDITRRARLSGGLFTAAYQWTLGGLVEGEVNFWGSRLEITGVVRAPVYASVGDPAADGAQIRSLLLPLGFDVALSPPGLVLGRTGLLLEQLEYSGPVAGTLEGTVLGAVTFHRVTPTLPALDEPSTLVSYGRDVLREFSALFVLGVGGWLLLPQLWTRPIITLRMRPIHSFSFGLLAFILSFPVIFILALLTVLITVLLVVVGLEGVATALGLLLVVVSGSFSGIFYFTAIYLSRVVSSWAVGRFLLRSLRSEMAPRRYALASLALGALVVSALAALPTIGWAINALALFFGLGALIVVLTDQVQQARGLTPPSSTPFTPVRVAAAPALPAEQPPPALPDLPGMANLPPGFDPERFFRD